MSIQQNAALFSLLGTFYGGNGTTTFGLPDLRGRLPVGQGQGPGLSNYTIGEQTGVETVTIGTNETPAHNHIPQVNSAASTSALPTGLLPATVGAPFTKYWVQNANKTGNPLPISATALHVRGGSQPHDNIMPVLAISIIIALSGIFPSRN